ncbi:MAG: leucine--tRNA ligase [Planctomycetes bacterium]|nr:leucine--tRNA ligase [Planctomycetota bacterium]
MNSDKPQGRYQPSEIEPKWQAYWEKHKTFHVGNPGDDGFDARKPKYYVLDMFPYTSGSGLHVGHPEGYTATDILSRYKRMKGFNVLHPIGWDSFGLPAEQYAVQTNVHPRVTTENAIKTFKRQLKRFGFSYDWDREFATTDLQYYKWTQWIFLKLFNSWFDDTAAKARPIDELIAELENGKWQVDADLQIVSSETRPSGSVDVRPWSKLSAPEQRKVLDNQRLAFMDEVPVNWCPMLGTVLSNEEVTNEGRSDRGDHPVYRKPLKQWLLRITKYCERLTGDIETVDWPESIKSMQRNWVGRSEGAQVRFKLAKPIDGEDSDIEVYTTRPDTLFGATYMVLAPEHALVAKITTDEHRDQVNSYVEVARNKSDLDRTADTKEKTGVFTGAHAINPANDKEVPIWVADYVLMGYGTGAIMAVPGQDERDWEFAEVFDLPIIRTVQPPDGFAGKAYTGEGPTINSQWLNGLHVADAKAKITSWLEERGLGRGAVNYKLRDWLFSRQRYWGEPFPILHGPDGEIVALDESELPLDLPHMDDFKPHASDDPNAPPRPPLGRAKDWLTVERDGKTYARELNTMPQWAGSCWYYLRYISATSDNEPWNREAEKYWMNVDQYVGGAEHAVLHLLYARFWHKVLYDLGYVSTVEPFQKLFNQGLIQSFAYKDKRGMTLAVDLVEEREEGKFHHKETGEPVEQIVAKMSKALKNVVNPDIILDEFGADTFRLYEMYMGPLDAAKPWNTRDIPGLSRFLARVWRLIIDEQTGELSAAVQDVEADKKSLRQLHKLIHKVGGDIEEFKLNTAIAEMIALTNALTSAKVRSKKLLEQFVLVLAPFAPHICEELWQRLGHSETLAYEPWPTYDPELAKDTEIEVPVQIKGKVRARIRLPADADQKTMETAALADETIKKLLEGKTVRKVIVVPGKLVNIVAN